MLPINDNSIDLRKYRGKITRCPHCAIKDITKADSVIAERMSMGKSCPTCLGHGFVALCTNCGGDGVFKGTSASFGGGDTPYHSACNPCGATGVFAVRKPADWKDEEISVSSPVPAVA
jgi:DnaJ-class molecular chaperone